MPCPESSALVRGDAGQPRAAPGVAGCRLPPVEREVLELISVPSALAQKRQRDDGNPVRPTVSVRTRCHHHGVS